MPRRKRERHPTTAAALAAGGGVYNVANQLGLSAAAVSKWYLVPLHWVDRLAEITGLPRHAIRPPETSGAAEA